MPFKSEGGGQTEQGENAFLATLQKDTLPETCIEIEDPLYCVIINLISGACAYVNRSHLLSLSKEGEKERESETDRKSDV